MYESLHLPKTAACCGWKLGWLEQWKFIRTEKLSEPPKKSKMKKKNWAESLCLIILGRFISTSYSFNVTHDIVTADRCCSLTAWWTFFLNIQAWWASPALRGTQCYFLISQFSGFQKCVCVFLNDVFVYDCYTAWIWLCRQDLKYKRSAVFKYSHRGEKEKKKSKIAVATSFNWKMAFRHCWVQISRSFWLDRPDELINISSHTQRCEKNCYS